MGADAIVLSGAATGRRADLDQVRRVSDAVDIPVLVGSVLARVFATAAKVS